MPFACCRAQQAKVVVSWVWLEDFQVPPPLSQPIPQSHFSGLALKCLQTLVTPSDASDELSATLDAHVLLRTAGQRDNRVGIIADMLDRRNAVRRYMPVRQPRVPRGAGGAADCCSSPCPSGAAGCTREGGGVGEGERCDRGSSLLTLMRVQLSLCCWLKVLTHRFCWT